MQAINIEQQLIEAEGRETDEDETLSIDDLLENKFDTDEIQRRIEREAGQQAEKSLRKNKREIERLKNHAQKCLLTDNFEGYGYAINKLREFYRRPKASRTELIVMYDDSRQTLFNIVKIAQKQQ
ncbi:hypothetical protein ZZ1p0116 [Acinetobacter phage ZZ1]|jgi:hypothetical protein|uniref:Uncharacterized protein n=3 Tax=Caudoviricetes TaxID=2731619 RepID=A0A410T5G0_9CAUD|nr:hypothetical protein ZZ1p0116 [Acinetobacter phage ZZ1]AFL47476.1 hypothetical protein ZZ1p0116 [Acinetobacter phage ZZ1]QAU03968.1 hypothetical protein Henu6_gp165 [Acinetobacter phage Henu6]